MCDVSELIDAAAYVRGLNIFNENRITKPALERLVWSLEEKNALRLKAIVCAPANSGNIALSHDENLPKARIEELFMSKLNATPNIRIRAVAVESAVEIAADLQESLMVARSRFDGLDMKKKHYSRTAMFGNWG